MCSEGSVQLPQGAIFLSLTLLWASVIKLTSESINTWDSVRSIALFKVVQFISPQFHVHTSGCPLVGFDQRGISHTLK